MPACGTDGLHRFAGHRSLVAGSPHGSDFKLLLAWIVPRAEATDAITLGRRADVVVLLGRSADAPSCRSRKSTGSRRRCDELLAAFRRHRGGPRRRRPGTTEIVAGSNPRARWAKSFSHLGYHDLEEIPGPLVRPTAVPSSL